MRKFWIVPVVLLAVIATSPAWGQAPIGIVGVSSTGPCSTESEIITGGRNAPFGFIDGHPTGNNAAVGILEITGWALDPVGIERIDIIVDGVTIAGVPVGGTRPDVAAVFPGFPDTNGPGFGYHIDTTTFPNGGHEVSARALSFSGRTTQLNTLLFDFDNTTHNLRPFGDIGYPNNEADLFGVCDVQNPFRRYTVIEGWALDLGVENNDNGIGYVELLIDGGIYANTRRDCHHSLTTGRFTNCYGIRRFDVEERFPWNKEAPHSGFRFVLDVGQLLDFGYAEGFHTLTVRAGDLDSQVNNVDSINVNFFCQDLFGNQGSFGAIDGPRGGLVGGIYEVIGWTLDFEGVNQVHVYVDGKFNGTATYGFLNEIISGRHPGLPDSAAPGFIYDLDTTLLSNGPHQIGVLVLDDVGDNTFIGEIEIQVFNP